MKRIRARTLLNYSTAELWDSLVGDFSLVFDNDVEITTNYRSTLYSSYAWDFHRQYPNTPLLHTHHVDTVLKGKMLNSKTHIDLLQNVYWSVVDAYQFPTPASRDQLTKMIYEITNLIYVDVSRRAEAFVTSIDILDFLEIVNHPDMKAVTENAKPCREDVEKINHTTLKLLDSGAGLEHNALVRASRAKMVNANQVQQCVGARGFLTEVDGVILQEPIIRNYTTGMRTAYNVLAESRSAAKSLYFSESPLEDAEYFARRLQLLCMVVERLHYTDCGSQSYTIWKVKPPVEVDGRTIYGGDLKFLVGKYYLDEETNTLKTITMDDTHLYSKTIKMRTVLHCKHHDKHGVCAVCFGKLHDNLSPFANLGHVCAATMTQQTSQSVLSTKHLDASSTAEPIHLGPEARRYFSVGRDKSAYLFSKDVKCDCVRFIVPQDAAKGLTDILVAERVEDISLSRISEIEFIGFRKVGDPIETTTRLTVSLNGRKGMFTYEFLRYIKKYGWEIDEKQNFVFSLEHWDYTLPVMRLPEMEYSFSRHSSQVAEMIESRMKDIGERSKPGTPDATLAELFDLVNAKLNVHISNLEVIVYASMIADYGVDDHSLARGSENASLGVANLTIRKRSLSALYAYRDQSQTMTEPRSFYKLNRPDSVFDVFQRPFEVCKEYSSK